MRDPVMGVTASLVAAISILRRAHREHKEPRKVVASDKMFLQMLDDYEAAVEAVLSKPTPVEAGLRERIAMVVMSWHHDMGNGDWPQDKVRAALDCINDEHSGDCTKQPWTCMRCDAEEAYRETDQILSALSKTQPPRETSTETKESGE